MAALSGLEKLKFVRKVATRGDEWEVRKVLKARLSLDMLEELRDRMEGEGSGGLGVTS